MLRVHLPIRKTDSLSCRLTRHAASNRLQLLEGTSSGLGNRGMVWDTLVPGCPAFWYSFESSEWTCLIPLVLPFCSFFFWSPPRGGWIYLVTFLTSLQLHDATWCHHYHLNQGILLSIILLQRRGERRATINEVLWCISFVKEVRRAQETKQRRALFNAETDAEEI